nr:hypothetical protein GCM10020092_106970 [Actinoplanes digitatis]
MTTLPHGPPADQRGRAYQQFVRARADDDGALLEQRPVGQQREADVERVGADEPGQVGGLPGERGCCTGGQHPRQRPVVFRPRRQRGRIGCLLDDGVRVGAADAERGHRAAADPLGRRVPAYGYRAAG